MDFRQTYKKETGRPVISQHGKHPKWKYVEWMETKLKEAKEEKEDLINQVMCLNSDRNELYLKEKAEHDKLKKKLNDPNYVRMPKELSEDDRNILMDNHYTDDANLTLSFWHGLLFHYFQQKQETGKG